MPKLRPIAFGAQITAIVYCPTHFLVLRLDRTGPVPYLLVWNAWLEGWLMELILGLIVPKWPFAGSFSGPPPLGGRHIIDFCHLKSQVVLEYASWVCVHSLRPVSLCLTSKIGLTCTNEGTKQVAKTGKMCTFQWPSIPGLDLKCKHFITRWLRNKPGQSWTTSAAKILMLALYGVVGQWKVTNRGLLGFLVNQWKKGLTENGISWSKKCQ